MSDYKLELYSLEGNAECEGRAIWQACFDRLPIDRKDLHFSPSYAEIFRRSFNQAVYVLIYQTNNLIVIQPFIMRSLPEQSTFFEHEKGCDIESLYGLGGPISSRPVTVKEADTYINARSGFLCRHGVISEFCSVHPFYSKEQKALLSNKHTDIVEKKHCAVIELHNEKYKIWADIEDRQKRAIIAARKSGVIINKPTVNEESLAKFHADYSKTMLRVNAGEQWRFGKIFFDETLACLGADNVSLFTAEYKGEQIASYMLIHSGETCYYHFSCSDSTHAKLNANHLLMFDTALWAKGMGFKYYFLGGGYSADGEDKLFSFKKSFTKRTYILEQVKTKINLNVYDDLESRFRAQGSVMPIKENYFPIYRS